MQVPFLVELQRVLKPGSVVRLATDWAPYGEWMVEQFELVPGFQPVQDQIRKAYSVEAEAVRGTTKFEARGERLGHDIRDLVYVKTQLT